MFFTDLVQLPGPTLVISIRKETKIELGKKLGTEAMGRLIERQLPLELYRWFHSGEVDPDLPHERIVEECKEELKEFNRLCINLDFFPCMNEFLDLGEWHKVTCNAFTSANSFQGQRVNLGSHVMLQKNGSFADLLFCTHLFADNITDLCIYTEFSRGMDFGGYNNGVLYSSTVLRSVDIISSLIFHGIDPKTISEDDPRFESIKLAYEKLGELSVFNGLCMQMLKSFDFTSDDYSITEVLRAIKYYNTARALRIFERKV